MRRLAAAVFVTVVALVAAACATKTAGEAALADTAGRLGRIKSGTMTMKVAATTADHPDQPVGFSVTGPFSLATPGALPVARLAYTRLAGTAQATVRFVADGERAWVIADGRSQALSPAQIDGLRAPRGDGGGAVTGLHLTSWFGSPEVKPAGAGMDRITGEVDAAAALADMLSLSSRYGATAQPLTRDEVAMLRRSVRSAGGELLTGHDDRLLHRLHLDVEFATAASGTLARAFGHVSGTRMTIDLVIADPNRPVRVDAGFTP